MWGKGINNEIGWGQAPINNIGFGDIHKDSWSGDTDISGVVFSLATNFQNRVIEDGGDFEAKECLIDNLYKI